MEKTKYFDVTKILKKTQYRNFTENIFKTPLCKAVRMSFNMENQV